MWLFLMPILKQEGNWYSKKNGRLLKATAEDLGTEKDVYLDKQKPLTLHDSNNFLLKCNKP